MFDEPFAGIDHNVRETLSLCDRAYVLFDDGILAQGDARAVTMDPSEGAHFLGETFELVAAGPALVTP